MHGHQKKPELTKFYSLFKLTALCALFHEAAALPLQDTAPVACGRPGHCTETPGLKLNLDGSPRIYKDGDSKAEITAFKYRTDAIIRMTATSNTTFELVNFVPANLEDVEIVMSFQGGPQHVYVALIESLPAHTIVELEYPFVTNPDGVFTSRANGGLRPVDLTPFSTGVAPGQVSFDYRGTSTIMQRLERLKSVPWTLSLHDFDPTGNPNNNWVDNLTPRHGRLWSAHILNSAYQFTHPDFADRMAAEPITDNQGALMSAEFKRNLLSRLLSSRRFNLGVVARVSGLGGGSTLGVADYVLRFAFFYGQSGITYHELGHCLGYSHASSMTYPTNSRGFDPLGQAFGEEMRFANDLLIDQTNYPWRSDHQVRCHGQGYQQQCPWYMRCTGTAYADGTYRYCEGVPPRPSSPPPAPPSTPPPPSPAPPPWGTQYIESCNYGRYLFENTISDVDIRSIRGNEGGWEHVNNRPVLTADDNYYNRACWNIRPVWGDLVFIESCNYGRYLFENSNSGDIRSIRGNEGGWEHVNNRPVLTADDNYYHRALWKLVPIGGGQWFIESWLTGRYLFENTISDVDIRSIRGNEGGWEHVNNRPVLTADDNYYNRACWKMYKL